MMQTFNISFDTTITECYTEIKIVTKDHEKMYNFLDILDKKYKDFKKTSEFLRSKYLNSSNMNYDSCITYITYSKNKKRITINHTEYKTPNGLIYVTNVI